MKILGTPVGSDRFVEAVTEEGLSEEKLWEALAWVLDLQCAWLQCAGPRCHHFLRTMPPCQSAQYAVEHDMGMRRAMGTVFPGTAEQTAWAAYLATLPKRQDGLGLRSAVRAAPAAFLGIMGGCTLHALTSVARADQSHCGGPLHPFFVDVSPSWTRQPGCWTAHSSWDDQGGTS